MDQDLVRVHLVSTPPNQPCTLCPPPLYARCAPCVPQQSYNVFTLVAGSKYTFAGKTSTARGATFSFEANDAR